ncbi:sigma-70 family RNA polymerase sigma factor [Chitinophaga sp. YIM B06452]|uniref:RNA polymerase sigma factor n=1 Tax=Chitinophaga sp. YIM B06452 TaxID=3082158 RepID=UPI0031FEB924
MHIENDDIEIVKQLIGGSERAFDALYHKYGRSAFLIALRYCGANKEEAQDAVQEVFAKLWERRGKLKAEPPISYLLFTMVKNAAINKYEKRNNALRRNGRYIEVEPQEYIPETNSRELVEELHRAIEKISAPATRQVLKMYYVDGKSYQEIVEITGMKLQTARKFVSQGVAFVRKVFKNPY